LFLSDLAWHDARRLLKERLAISIADQLVRAASKISSDVAEGYSRATGKGRAVFYDYALGSTRETRDWYYKGRNPLGQKIAAHRIALTTTIIRLLLTMASNERRTNRKLSVK
jgi:four helix bundle protein